MIKIKNVSPKEKKKIEAFSLREWKAHNKKHNYSYKDKEFFVVAFDGKEIVGQIQGNTNGGVAYLEDIIISRKHRNKGIGKMLLAKFEEIAKKNKCHVCFLATTDKHPEAIEFYKKTGYVKEATLSNMYWHTNEYYMVKRLAA